MANSPLLVLVVLIQSSICSIGLLTHLFFIYIHLRNSHLRVNVCGCLLLVLSCTHSLSEMALSVLPPITFLTSSQIPLNYCFWAELLNPFADAIGYNVIFFISLDRLLCVLVSVRYRNLSTNHKGKIVALLVCIGAAYSFHNANWYYQENIAPNPKLPVYCLPSDFMKGNSLNFFNNTISVIFIGAIVNYAILWILVYRNKAFANKQNEMEKRITKSIFILMILIFCCMLPVPVLRAYLLPNLSVSADTTYLLGRIILLLWKIAPALEVPTLYFSSTDYRVVIRKELYRLFKIKSFNSSKSMAIMTVGGKNTVAAYSQHRHRNQSFEMSSKGRMNAIEQMQMKDQHKWRLSMNSAIIVNNFVSNSH